MGLRRQASPQLQENRARPLELLRQRVDVGREFFRRSVAAADALGFRGTRHERGRPEISRARLERVRGRRDPLGVAGIERQTRRLDPLAPLREKEVDHLNEEGCAESRAEALEMGAVDSVISLVHGAIAVVRVAEFL